jgi:hypothetical protein
MNNPYTSMFMPTGFDQNQQGLTPVFQNIAQQQANQNAALQEQNQQVQQAGQTVKQSNVDGLALAKLLRKPNDPYAQAQDAMKQYGASNVYGYGGQGQVPTNPNFSMDSF